MGSSESKPEQKTVDTTGNVNNNVVIGRVSGEVDVYSVEIVILLGIICAIKLIEFIYFIYQRHYHKIKRHVNDQPRA